MSHSPGSYHLRPAALTRTLGVIPLALTALVGCEEFNQLPTPPPVEVKKPALPIPAPPVAAAPVEETAEYQRPEYPENIRRNPFQPDPDKIKPVGPIKDPEGTRPIDPLEAFSLNQLELSAIISEVAVPKAMFIDPSGFGHVVKEGDRIAKGVITDIRDNEVDVQESISEGAEGASQVRTLTLRTAEIRSENQDDLSDSERQALEKLLDSEAGRRALRDKLRNETQGASAVDGEPPPDTRFGGIEPPK